MTDAEQQAPRIEQSDLFAVAPGIGDALQLQDMADPRQRYHVSLIGIANKRSVLVSHPEKDGVPVPVSEGQGYTVRGFSDRKTYEFAASIIGIGQQPYPYLHLSFPAQIEVVNLRGAVRIRVKLPCVFGAPGLAPKSAAGIEDISTSGTRIQSRVEVGRVGDTIETGFTLPIGGEEIALVLPAVIRNLQADEGESGTVFRYGVEFVHADARARMSLQTFIYRTLSEG